MTIHLLLVASSWDGATQAVCFSATAAPNAEPLALFSAATPTRSWLAAYLRRERDRFQSPNWRICDGCPTVTAVGRELSRGLPPFPSLLAVDALSEVREERILSTGQLD